jgi:hypothetical protein
VSWTGNRKSEFHDGVFGHSNHLIQPFEGTLLNASGMGAPDHKFQSLKRLLSLQGTKNTLAQTAAGRPPEVSTYTTSMPIDVNKRNTMSCNGISCQNKRQSVVIFS